MALVCPHRAPSSPPDGPQSLCVAFACGQSVIVGSAKPSPSPGHGSVSVHQLQVGSSPVACLAVSPTGTVLAVSTEDKVLKVWSATTWEMVGERVIPKRATTVQFAEDDRCLLVADKTGEVTSYVVSSISTDEGRHLLGHFSMILDMALSPSNSHVITCDRDEKIRVSRYPNSYNIETFCMGHTEFVSVLSSSGRWPNILLSGGGDATVRTWAWLTGELLHTEKVDSQPQNQEPTVVTQLTCSHCAKESVVMVALEGSASLLSYILTCAGKLTPNPDGVISLATPPWSCVFDWSDRLWVSLPQPEEPLQCHRLEKCKFVQIQREDNPLLKSLCNWEYFKDCKAITRDWSQLRKHTFDNMSAYLAKKEERIRSKEAAKRIQETELEAPLQPRPAKAARLERGRSAESNDCEVAVTITEST